MADEKETVENDSSVDDIIDSVVDEVENSEDNSNSVISVSDDDNVDDSNSDKTKNVEEENNESESLDEETIENLSVDDNLSEVNEDNEQISENDIAESELDDVDENFVPEVNRDYFDDDEEFLAGDDAEIYDEDALSMFQQSDKVVSVEVLNLYTPEGNLRNRLSLRSDPPILEIKSNDGQTAQFILTKNFSYGLLGKIDDAYSAYFGIQSKTSKNKKKRKDKDEDEKLTFQDRVNNGLNWMQDNKGKTFMGVIIVFLVIFGLVF